MPLFRQPDFTLNFPVNTEVLTSCFASWVPHTQCEAATSVSMCDVHTQTQSTQTAHWNTTHLSTLSKHHQFAELWSTSSHFNQIFCFSHIRAQNPVKSWVYHITLWFHGQHEIRIKLLYLKGKRVQRKENRPAAKQLYLIGKKPNVRRFLADFSEVWW